MDVRIKDGEGVNHIWYVPSIMLLVNVTEVCLNAYSAFTMTCGGHSIGKSVFYSFQTSLVANHQKNEGLG